MIDLSNENVIHVKKDGIEYLQFRRLLEYKDKIVHAYTMRPLNYRFKAKEDEDYLKICNSLGVSNLNIVKPMQTHTNNVEIVNKDSVSADFNEVDGLVTAEKNKVLATVYADCTPLFFYDPVKNVIGDVHSGWRGTVAKIGKCAVEKMVRDFGCNPQDIICCIGPTIRQCHFQVEDDVKDLYLNAFFKDENLAIVECNENGLVGLKSDQNLKFSSMIKKDKIIDGKQKYYINTAMAVVKTMLECGLKNENIIDSGICTVCNHDLFHSHRADRENAGRNAAIMGLV